MTRLRRVVVLASAGAVLLVALGCDTGQGDGGRAVVTVGSSARCLALGFSPFPPGLDWLPGGEGRAVALSFAPSTVIPLDASGDTPVGDPGVGPLGIPDDSDGDGVVEGTAAQPDFPQLDGVFVSDPALGAAGLGLVTASGYEEVIVFRPDAGTLAPVEVSVDASFAAADFRRLPPPGTAALRTAISTDVCFKPAEPLADSLGNDYAAGFPSSVFCDPDARGSFYARFTSGAAVASGRLFVSMSNLAGGGDTETPQYLPGAVLVYDVDLGSDPPRVSPNVGTPFIETTGFNPTHVTRYEVGGREYVLVTVSGAIGIEADDPGTPEVEQGTLALTDGAIEVIDAQTLEHLGEIPLGLGALTFDRLAIDPSARAAVVGSALARELYVVDLAGLSAAVPDLSSAVVFDADAGLEIPALAGGPTLSQCAPLVGGIAWNAAGDRLYATERCDGSFSELDVSLAELPGGELDPDGFVLRETRPLLAPLAADTLGDVRDPGLLRVRPGVPGIDYTGPDLLFLASQPNGQACALRIESR